MDSKGLWRAVLGELEVSVSRANFSTWFSNTSILSSNDGHIVVGVPNIFAKSYLEKQFDSNIQDAINKIHPHFSSIEYKVAAVTATDGEKQVSKKREPLQQKRLLQTSLPSAPTGNHNLNTRYTFDTYVVGSSNELAYAACQAVAKEPGTKYNPLYLYGGVGLGKTHLMQAVGNEILKRDPTQRIEYITIESFTNEFISSIQKKKNESFVDKYRQVDVLIIDDMQFLAGKEKTQDEFFHTFNALHQANKQIIISSDKPPQLLRLEDRLLSRFSMGMTADVQTPDLETRSAILQSKAAEKGIILPLDVVEYLARHSQNNIRELEGALTKLMAHCELKKMDPSIEVAQSLVAGVNAGRPKLKPLSPRAVIERVASYFDLLPADLLGAKRDRDIVLPRQITMYLMRHEMDLSFPKIAAAVGGRDHTTAMHSVSKIEKAIEHDDNLRADVQSLRERLQLQS